MTKIPGIGAALAKVAFDGLTEAQAQGLRRTVVPRAPAPAGAPLPEAWRHRAAYLKAQAQMVQQQHIDAERMAGHQYIGGFLCFEARELLAQANTLELCAHELESQR